MTSAWRKRLMTWIDAALRELDLGYGAWWRAVDATSTRSHMLASYTGRLAGLRYALNVGRFNAEALRSMAEEVSSLLLWLACSTEQNQRRFVETCARHDHPRGVQAA